MELVKGYREKADITHKMAGYSYRGTIYLCSVGGIRSNPLNVGKFHTYIITGTLVPIKPITITI